VALAEDGVATIWKTGPLRREGELAKAPRVTRAEAADIAASQSRVLVAASEEGTDDVVDDASLTSERDLNAWQCATSIEIPSRGSIESSHTFVLGGRGDGSIAIWSAKTRDLVELSLQEPPSSASAGGSVGVTGAPGILRLFPEAAGRGYRPTRRWTDHRSVGLVALQAMGKGLFAASSAEGSVGVWRVTDERDGTTDTRRYRLEEVWKVSGDTIGSNRRPVRGLCSL